MARATSRAGLGTQRPDSRRRPLRERPGSPSPSCAPTRGRKQVGAAPDIAAETHTRDSDRVRRDPIEPFRPSRIHCRTASRRPVKIKRVALRPPSWGGGNRDGIRPLTSPAASLPFSLVQVLPLERLRFRDGPFRILPLRDPLRDQFLARIPEAPSRRATLL